MTSRTGRVLETSDPATLLVSLARNIPGAIYRCALDRDWTMHLIGEEIERITGYPAEDFVENRRRTFVSLIPLRIANTWSAPSGTRCERDARSSSSTGS